MLCDACPDWEDKLGYCAKMRLKRTDAPTTAPTIQPTSQPTDQPTAGPTEQPTNEPTNQPTNEPTNEPTNQPTNEPTNQPTVAQPTQQPTDQPTNLPTSSPTNATDDLRTSPPVDALEACDNDTSKLATAEEACKSLENTEFYSGCCYDVCVGLSGEGDEDDEATKANTLAVVGGAEETKKDVDTILAARDAAVLDSSGFMEHMSPWFVWSCLLTLLCQLH